ncbi:GATA-type zinc finger transcription factor [Phycomyces blakesleeanus NRRL 1555(-)]|uniref:GATA-type zinc finger transcription factor n=1 Tax=Phycomyces blakesleeanus (strain ATCC 8743b / DSM 1359 / FGSC 10004 / NBRC 33097 / NRRL 1555) TaxID=763407 RepID=A0A167RFH2_PHYB8|nr:GATA-type zinc finger transcription factor [Phycomyces blakesleeanus NRRL 1555(-)]OAD81529.1 GATA-type zinc finger transcription factor [Phycomyces blakesleeanus NRRL 1555(-)]|eukprot:XP_018299569.1 GATA-type zinc finger transcription factor [Phycomyces blakesleeanus NRRL 1555(-)]
MFWASSSLSYFLLKDDIFFSQPPTHDLIQSSLALHQSLAFAAPSPLNIKQKTPSPNLSPVTSPSGLLYDHEPLFDGLEDLDLSQPNDSTVTNNTNLIADNDNTTTAVIMINNNNISESPMSTHQSPQDYFSVLPYPSSRTTIIDDSLSDQSPQLEWSALLDHFNDDNENDENNDDNTTTTTTKITKKGSRRNKINNYESSESDIILDYDYHYDSDIDTDTNSINSSTRTSNSNSNNSSRSSSIISRRNSSLIIPRHGLKRKRLSIDSDTSLEPEKPFKRLLNTTTAVTSSSSPSQSPSFSSSTPRPTVFESLTDTGVDWCRYCGTTESVNWRPGPWGKRTLCNKHGCDYKGYGLVSRLPRLDLSAFVNEPIQDRICPVIQEFCAICRSPGFTSDNLLVKCQGGCSRAYHQLCRSPIIGSHLFQDTRWYCSSACRVNRLKNRVVVDLPRNHLPLMIRNQKRH